MALSDLLELAKKQFIKKNPDVELEFNSADKEKPATGLLVNNPLLEFILDRRFLAYGRFMLLYGKKGSSKTSLFLDFIKLFQKNQGDAIWIETEHAIDLDYAKKQGVDLTRVSVLHPDTLEQGLELAEGLIRNMPKAYPDGNTPVLIGYDSIAGSAVEDEIDSSKSITDVVVGKHARLLARFYREMEKPLAAEKCVFMVLNQLKNKIGAMGYGDDYQDALIGGEAQFFHSSYHFKMSKTAELAVKVGEDGAERKIGSQHKIRCLRNKLGREGKGQDVELDLYIDGGIDWWSPLVRKLGKQGYDSVLTRKGGYYYWTSPGIKYKNADGVETVIDTEQAFRESELGKIIKDSPAAQEEVRKAFGIPALPSETQVQEIESERKKKRGRPGTKAPLITSEAEVKELNLIEQ